MSVDRSTYATKLVNINKTKKYDVYIGRAGKGLDGYFGNPFPLADFNGDREKCIAAYREYFYKRIEEDDEFADRIESLRGKTLGCFCWPNACHGEVIIEYLRETMQVCGICTHEYHENLNCKCKEYNLR